MPNVFDENTVPVKMQIDGKEVTIGQAKISDIEKGFYHVDIDLAADSAEDVKKFLSGDTVAQYSIDNPSESISTHEHIPKQHRDGKPKWCDICGLTADLTQPVSRLPEINRTNKPELNFGFPKPPGRINRSNN